MSSMPCDPFVEKLQILHNCPNWDVTWASKSQHWEARSPSYKTDGIVVHGRSASEVVTRIRSLH